MRNPGLLKVIRNLSPFRSARLLVAVSGGADSTALLHTIASMHIDAVAAHCNFHLRGDESNRDSEFVSKLCSDLGIKLLIKDFDVEKYRKVKKISIETACRDLRYEWFEELMAEQHCERIVTAHNADDNVETLLLNLFRGAGLNGLAGMPVDNGKLLRPMLTTFRSEILDWLSQNRLSHVEDSTNASIDYRRNFIRNTILPQIETRWPAARKTILHTQNNLRSELDIINSVRADYFTDTDLLTWEYLDTLLSLRDFLHHLLKGRGANKQITQQVSDCVLNHTTGKQWHTASVDIYTSYNGLHIIDKSDLSDKSDKSEVANTQQVSISLDSSNPLFDIEVIHPSEEIFKEIQSKRDNAIAWLPGTPSDYVLRNVRSGDHIRLLGGKGSSSVIKILKDNHIPQHQRKNQLIVCHKIDDEPVWIPGLKRAGNHLVTLETTAIVKLSLKKTTL